MNIDKNKDQNTDESSISVIKTDAQWQAELTDEEFYVCRKKGTEHPYTGKLLNNNAVGIYHCKCCGSELFSSDSKFNSGCGWPSFDKEIKAGAVVYTEDNSLAMQRIEVTCSNCDAHLGHVFPDGPTETGQRFCINSISMGFNADNND